MPPIAAVTGGIVIVLLCFLIRIPIFLIGVLAVVLCIYTIFIHKGIFGLEYRIMSAPDFMKDNASIFIVLAIILGSLGYILFLFGPKAAIQNRSTSTPSKSSWFGSSSTPSSTPSKSSWFGSSSNPNRSRSYNDENIESFLNKYS